MSNFNLIGNAQMIGRRENQSNYFSTIYNDDGDMLAILSDGLIDHPNARKGAILAVEFCNYEFSQNRFELTNEKEAINTILKVNKFLQETIYTSRIPRISISISLFIQDILYFFNVGINKLYLYNEDNERLLNYDKEKAYSFGKYKLNPKNIVSMYSSGIYSSTHPLERIKIINEKEYTIFEKSQNIIEIISSKNLENQANATAVLIEVKK